MINGILIEQIKIGKENSPFIIAEMSGNHNQSLDRAIKIVEIAAKSGANAIKLQTYTADTMTLDVDSKDFLIEDKNSLWYGEKLHDLYKKAYTPWEWHEPIFKRCKELGLICFSTPFDETAVDFLESLNVPCYKIASFENNHLPLINKIAKTGKPIFLSTGLASIADLYDAVNEVKSVGNENITLLKCTSAYPATLADVNLLTIPHMQDLFNCNIGLSDHTLGIGVAIASVALGATVIEKHFTLDRNDGGVDSAFSLEPDELKNLVIETKRAWEALGKVSYNLSEKEQRSVQFRRSLYISKDINAGDILTLDNIKIVRPGFGLAPKYLNDILGKKINIEIKAGTPVSWKMLG
jgi:N-acetylneuraminate synthase